MVWLWDILLPNIEWSRCHSVSYFAVKCRKNGYFHTFWAAAPRSGCPVGHRGEFPDVRPSIHPSVRPPLLAIKVSNPLRPDLDPLRPHISSPGLKSVLQASNQLSRTHISSQGFKSALPASNLCSRPQICARS